MYVLSLIGLFAVGLVAWLNDCLRLTRIEFRVYTDFLILCSKNNFSRWLTCGFLALSVQLDGLLLSCPCSLLRASHRACQHWLLPLLLLLLT